MLTLGISTSSSNFAIVLGENQKIIYHSSWIEISDIKDIKLLFTEGLKYTNKSINEIKRIIVNNGPGGTSSVRTGVAFANSLAFSLNIPVCPVSSLELAGIYAWEKNQIPVISTVKSIKQNAFISCFQSYNQHSISYGKVKDILPCLVKNIEEFTIVGYHKDEIKELFPNKKIHDTGLYYGDVEMFIKKEPLFIDRFLIYPKFAVPVNEQNI